MISNKWIFNWNFEFRKKMKISAEYYEIVFTDCAKNSALGKYKQYGDY